MNMMLFTFIFFDYAGIDCASDILPSPWGYTIEKPGYPEISRVGAVTAPATASNDALISRIENVGQGATANMAALTVAPVASNALNTWSGSDASSLRRVHGPPYMRHRDHFDAGVVHGVPCGF